MSEITVTDSSPGPQELRRFGLLLGALIAVFFGALPALVHDHFHLWPWVTGAGLWAAAFCYPRGLRYVHAGWNRLGLVLGWINTRVVLTLVFIVGIVPAGIVMRLLGRDRLERRFEPGRESYRRSSRTRDPQGMERPY